MSGYILAQHVWNNIPSEKKELIHKMYAINIEIENRRIKDAMSNWTKLKEREEEARKKQEINNIIIITSVVLCVPAIIFIFKKIF